MDGERHWRRKGEELMVERLMTSGVSRERGKVGDGGCQLDSRYNRKGRE